MAANKAKEYRTKAFALAQRAEKVRNPTGRQRLNDLARLWRELADHVEQLKSDEARAVIPSAVGLSSPVAPQCGQIGPLGQPADMLNLALAK